MSLKIPTTVNRGKRFALIDGDILVYRSGFAGQTKIIDVYTFEGKLVESFPNKQLATEWLEYYWDDEDWDWHYSEEVIVPDPVENVLHTVRKQIDTIVEAVEAYDYKVFLTNPEGTFRDEIATIKKYKGNRENLSKPIHYQAIRDYLIEHHGANVSDNLEADDHLGIEMTNRDDAVICTLDKDLDMIPGLHYNWVEQEWNDVTPEEGLRSFYIQLLTGDAVDNIQGIPGLGEVGAKAIIGDLTDPRKMYDKVVEVYNNYYEDEKEANAALVENARLLWIMRSKDNGWEAPQE